MTARNIPSKQKVITAASVHGAMSPYQAMESARKDLDEQLRLARSVEPDYVITNISHQVSEWKLTPAVTVIATLDVLSAN